MVLAFLAVFVTIALSLLDVALYGPARFLSWLHPPLWLTIALGLLIASWLLGE